jgi:hypothetical protein
MFSIASLAQTVEVTLPLTPREPPGAPVEFTGTITALENVATSRYSYDGQATATNLTEKGICLLALRVKASGLIRSELSETGFHDFFFAKSLLAPGNSQKISVGVAPQGTVGGNITPKAAPPDAVANLKLLFVQFSDGSTWGDSTVAAKTLKDRQAAFDAMKSLLATYQLKGEKEFITELLQGPSLTALQVTQACL